MSTEQNQKTEKEKLLAGEWYHAGYSELQEDRKLCRALLKQYDETPQGPERHQIATKLFGAFGEGSFVNVGFKCDYGYNIYVGKNSEVNFNGVFLDCGKIKIGDNVFMGPGVHIYAVTHPLDPTLRKTGIEMGQDVIIEDGVWIGGGAIICPGVTIGAGTTIGAGAVVTKNIPGNVLAVGNPARVIKETPPSEPKE
jgi:maltose O-acetyltransferase